MSYARQLRAFFDGVTGVAETSGLGVYRDMYRLRLTDALRTDFPRLVTSVGEERFAELAELYRRRHPSTTPSLRHYARHFSTFLFEVERARPHLAELAALEWARVDVCDERDEAALSMRDLGALSAPALMQLPLQRIAALRIVPARFAVEDLWQRPVEQAAAPPRQVRQSQSAILVWRVLPNRVYHRRVDEGELEWLHLLRRATTLPELCARGEAPAGELVTRLQRLAHDGLVRRGDAASELASPSSGLAPHLS